MTMGGYGGVGGYRVGKRRGGGNKTSPDEAGINV